MKNLSSFSLLVFVTLTFTSCEIVGGIFKAGMGVGIFAVLAVAVFIFWLVTRARKP
jgi:hypothetical protein